MVITYQGDGYLKLQSGDSVLLVDPTNQRSVRGASAVIFTQYPAPAEFNSAEIPVISHQGEYEIKGIRIDGATAEQDGDSEISSYCIRFDDIVIGILGPITKDLEAKALLPLQGSDILILPGGDGAKLPAAAAAKIVRQIEPSVVIPSFVSKNASAFLKELGGTSETLDRLTVKKKDLPPNAMKAVVLESQ